MTIKDPIATASMKKPLTKALCLALVASVGCKGPIPQSEPDPPGNPANVQILNRGEGKDRWWDALPRAAWSEFQTVDQSQDWFEVYEIRPGVLAIYEPGQFEEVISYLIIGSERSVLFDTGLGIGDMAKLVSELTGDQTLGDIVVVNSHTHYDHVGGNHAFEVI